MPLWKNRSNRNEKAVGMVRRGWYQGKEFSLRAPNLEPHLLMAITNGDCRVNQGEGDKIIALIRSPTCMCPWVNLTQSSHHGNNRRAPEKVLKKDGGCEEWRQKIVTPVLLGNFPGGLHKRHQPKAEVIESESSGWAKSDREEITKKPKKDRFRRELLLCGSPMDTGYSGLEEKPGGEKGGQVRVPRVSYEHYNQQL